MEWKHALVSNPTTDPIGRGAAVQAVLYRAGQLFADGTMAGRSPVHAIVAAVAEQAADQAQEDTLANAAISCLVGYWHGRAGMPGPKMARLSDWAQAATVDEVVTNLNNAAAEIGWLAGPAQPSAAAWASPLAQAEQAKRERDFFGEMGALKAGHEALTSAPWYPAQAGDIMHVHFEAMNTMPACGETYVVEHDEQEGGLVLRVLHADAGLIGPGGCAPGMVDDPFMEAWMEAGPASLTIVRAGHVIHGPGASQ